ncbi:MAG: Gfo/Idh/MocA family protein [bacterium]
MSSFTNRPINLAFLGCGFATHLHSKTLSGFKNEVRRFYASRDPEKAARYNRKYKGSGYFESYAAALASPEIDVVLVATPPTQHLELTQQAMQAGKHVIVEKPPFLHSDDFEAVRKVCEETDRRVFIAENYFYKPLAVKLRDILRSGAIGEVLFLHVNALKQQATGNWRDNAELAGGGALFEGGIHWIDFLANLGLELKSVRGMRPAPTDGLEKSILVALEYENGPVGAFYYSWEVPSLLKGLRLSKIYGRRGSITFESNGVFLFVRGTRKRLVFPGLKDIAGYKAMFRDFFCALREDREPEFGLNLAKQDLVLIESIYESLNQQ